MCINLFVKKDKNCIFKDIIGWEATFWDTWMWGAKKKRKETKEIMDKKGIMGWEGTCWDRRMWRVKGLRRLSESQPALCLLTEESWLQIQIQIHKNTEIFETDGISNLQCSLFKKQNKGKRVRALFCFIISPPLLLAHAIPWHIKIIGLLFSPPFSLQFISSLIPTLLHWAELCFTL